MDNPSWKGHARRELESARLARQAGNEGRARVCARRAAGLIAGEYLRRLGYDLAAANAYERLLRLSATSQAPEPARQMAGHFLVRVTPEHELPLDADLIEEASRLAELLLGERP